MPNPVKGGEKQAKDMNRYKYRQAIGYSASHLKLVLAGSFFLMIVIIHLAISTLKFFILWKHISDIFIFRIIYRKSEKKGERLVCCFPEISIIC